jgi:hypothetical protein
VIIVLGFVAVALWRLEQAIWGYRYVSDTKKQLRKRGTAAFKAAVFATLAVVGRDHGRGQRRWRRRGAEGDGRRARHPRRPVDRRPRRAGDHRRRR